MVRRTERLHIVLGLGKAEKEAFRGLAGSGERPENVKRCFINGFDASDELDSMVTCGSELPSCFGSPQAKLTWCAPYDK